MRTNYLLIVVIMLLAAACKKETEIVNQSATAVDAPPSCWGNNWGLDDLYYGDVNENNYLSAMPPWVYNNKIYVPDDDAQVVRIYDGTNWQTIASNIDIDTHGNVTSFTIGNKGYLLITTSGQLWQYNFNTNNWSERTDYPGERRYSPATFTIGSKGYVAGGGNEDGRFKDVWEYNPSTNAWVRKADLPYPVSSATGFTIDSKGYIVTGHSSLANYKRLYEYDPLSNAWSAKAPFPGEKRNRSIAFVISGKAYVGGGYTGTGGQQFSDYYRYNPVSNAWITVAGMPVPNSRSEHGFTLNSKGYGVFFFGSDYGMLTYTPQYCAPGSSSTSGIGAAN